MDNNRRKGDLQSQGQLVELLSEAQKQALRQMERFGWQLEFLRQPLFQESVAVILSGEGDKIGVLDPDGRIELKPNLEVRK